MVGPCPCGVKCESGGNSSRVNHSCLYLPSFLPLSSLFLGADRPYSLPDYSDNCSADHSFVQLMHPVLLPDRRIENGQSREAYKYADGDLILGYWHTFLGIRASFDIVHDRTSGCRRCSVGSVALVHFLHIA